MKYAISSCLMGVCCKYNGSHNKQPALIEFMKDKEYILVCPEIAGGMSIPRACSEIVGHRVMNTEQDDVTAAFEKGAAICLNTIIEQGVDVIITQPRSPSCGKGMIYDGSFSKVLIEGDGIFVQLCKQHNCNILNVDEFLFDIKRKI